MSGGGAVSIRDGYGATGTIAAAPPTLTARLLGETRLPRDYADDGVWDTVKPDANWIWVLEQEGEIVGMLVGAPAYPYVTLLRARIDPGTPPSGFLVLLRQFFRDARQRTFTSMLSHFDFSQEAEKRLALCMTKFFGGKLYYNVTAQLPKGD